jgi:hypothetical protein
VIHRARLFWFELMRGGAVAAAPPVNSVAPAVTGFLQTGVTLSCDTGSWTNSPSSYAYQWKRAGVDISGATASTYVLAVADEAQAIRCDVTATNGFGSATAQSNARTPPVVFFDNFNRANENLEVSANWTLSGTAGSGRVIANEVGSNISTSPGARYNSPAPASIDHFVDITTTNQTTSSFACVRLRDTGNYVGVRRSSSNINVFTVITGTVTSRYSAASTAGDRFRLEAEGTTFRLRKWNGTSWDAPVWSATFSDTTLNDTNATGFVFRAALDANGSFDNFYSAAIVN